MSCVFRVSAATPSIIGSATESWMRLLGKWATVAGLVCGGACGTSDASEDGRSGTGGAGARQEGSPSNAVDDANQGERYALDANWLCNPATTTNRCQTRAPATEVAADGSLLPVDAPPQGRKRIDCFYVYPTVDLQLTPGRASNFQNVADIWATARVQAEPFADLCDVYAPLYHQATVGTYFNTTRQEELLELAYDEIDEAFQYYMAEYNAGRKIVLIGHSQGSHMLRRLLQRRFDGPDNREVRDQLAVALLIGSMGDFTVPPGERVGGSFDDIPLCSRLGQVGCVVSFNAYPSRMPPTDEFGLVVEGVADGMEAPCTNPAALGGGKAQSAGAFFQRAPAGLFTGTTKLPTLGSAAYFGVFRDFYGLECGTSDDGQPYLAVSVLATDDDQRADPIDYMADQLLVDVVGLHVLDFNLTLDDLLNVVRAHTD